MNLNDSGSIALEKPLVLLVILEILLKMLFVVVQLQSLPDILAVVIKWDSALLCLLGLSGLSWLQVVLV